MTTTEADKLLNPDELRTICPIELRSCLETMRLIPLNDLVAPVVEAAEAHLTQLEAGGKGVDIATLKKPLPCPCNGRVGRCNENAYPQGWNDCIDHLAAQGHLQPAKPEKLLTGVGGLDAALALYNATSYWNPPKRPKDKWHAFDFILDAARQFAALQPAPVEKAASPALITYALEEIISCIPEVEYTTNKDLVWAIQTIKAALQERNALNDGEGKP